MPENRKPEDLLSCLYKFQISSVYFPKRLFPSSNFNNKEVGISPSCNVNICTRIVEQTKILSS